MSPSLPSRRSWPLFPVFFATWLIQSCASVQVELAGDNGPTAPERTFPREALAQEWWMTRDPALGAIPVGRLAAARRAAAVRGAGRRGAHPGSSRMPSRMPSQGLPRGPGGDLRRTAAWESRGPDEVGGRVRALAIDPGDPAGRRAFAGGVSGGLWVIDDVLDPGARWRLASPDIAVQPITALAFDPADPDVMFAGTGEGWVEGGGVGMVGTGIWASTDAGTTWALLGASASMRYVNDLEVRRESGALVLYAAVDASDYNGAGTFANHGLYRSIDGGSSFAQVLPSAGTSAYAPAEIDIAPNGRLLVGTLNNPNGEGGGTVLRSFDGITWTAAALGGTVDRVKVRSAPSDLSRVYALVEGSPFSTRLMRSVDGGVSWSNIASAPVLPSFYGYQPFYNLALGIDPGDPDKVFAGAVLFGRSLDGGQTVEGLPMRVHPDNHEVLFLGASPGDLLSANDGGIAWIQGAFDPQPSFANRNRGLTITQLYAVAIDPRAGADRFLIGSQDNDARFCQGPGLTSSVVVEDGDGGYGFFDADDADLMMATRQSNQWSRSTDGGLTWTRIPGQVAGGFINPADYDSARNVLYSGGDHTQLQRIRDMAGNPAVDTIPVDLGLQMPGLGTLTSLRLDASGTRLFAGTWMGRLMRIDGPDGPSPQVTEIGSPSFPPGSLSCIEVGADMGTGPMELRVTFSNYGVDSVWETLDGGQTWRPMGGDLPDMPVRWLLTDPGDRNHILLATELGIWETRSADAAMPTWRPLVDGPPAVRTTMLRYRSSDGVVAAATYGRGLFTGLPFGAPCTQAPTIASASPGRGPCAGGNVITLRGRDFTADTKVTVGGVPALGTSLVDSQTLLVTVPPCPGGVPEAAASAIGGPLNPNSQAVSIQLVTPCGSASLAGAYRYVP